MKIDKEMLVAALADGLLNVGDAAFGAAASAKGRRRSRVDELRKERLADAAERRKERESLQRGQLEMRRQAFAELKERNAERRAERQEAVQRRRQRYQMGKDWIRDFYRRNEIYMKTGHRVPDNFSKLLEDASGD